MNFEQPKNENIKNPESKVKEGVDFVFEQNPELVNIGTEVQYSKFLETIFPDSKVKDIVYHGTGSKFENFKKPKELDSGRDNGIYFTSAIEEKGAKWYAENRGNDNEAYLISALINIKNLLKESSLSRVTDIPDGRLEDYIEKGIDGIFGELISKDKNKILDEYVVFEPEQIHILGSKTDIEKFKEFVSESKSEQVTV